MTPRFFDVQHPMFKPLWLRIVIVGFTLGWAAFELFVTQSPFWAILFGAIGVYLAHQFLIAFNPRPPEPKDRP